MNYSFIKFIRGDETKKILVVLAIVLLIPVSIFANSLFSVTVGATAAYQKTGALESMANGEFDFEELSLQDFKTGLDVGVRILFVEANGKAFFTETTDGDSAFNGIVSANLVFDFAIVRFKAGIGYQYLFNLSTEDVVYGSIVQKTDFEDFKDANLDLYVGIDLMLGGLVVNAYVTMPTTATLNNASMDELFAIADGGWKTAQIGVGIGFSLI